MIGPHEDFGRLDEDTLADVLGVDEVDLDDFAEDPEALAEALDEAEG